LSFDEPSSSKLSASWHDHRLWETESIPERPAFDQRHGLEFVGADIDPERNPDRG
jgi:hypothetical protein